MSADHSPTHDHYPVPEARGSYLAIVVRERATILRQLGSECWTKRMVLLDLQRRFGPGFKLSYNHFLRLLRSPSFTRTPNERPAEPIAAAAQGRPGALQQGPPAEPTAGERFPGTGGTFKHRKKPNRDDLF